VELNIWQKEINMRDLISHISIRMVFYSLLVLILKLFITNIYILLILPAVILYLLEIKGILTYQSPSDIEREKEDE
jgi:small neutral amino acid transporter SnatA (MarC family)